MGNSAQTQTANNSAQNSATNSLSASNYGSNTLGQSAQNTTSATGPSEAAAALIRQATNPSNTIANISSFMNPYTKSVLDAQIALENQQNAVQQNQLTGNAIAQGALGGNRAQDAAALLAGQQMLSNNATNSGVLQQGYNTALQAAQQTAAQQLQGASLSGTQSAGSTAGQTSQSTLGSVNSAQNSATAQAGTGSGSSTTTQIPGLASNIGLGLSLAGMLKDGGAVGHADGGKATIGGMPAFDAGGAVAGQFVWVPSQDGGMGQYVWVPAQQSSGQQQGQAQGAPSGTGAGSFNSGVQQGHQLGEMYHLGQKARTGLSNLFDSMGSEGASNKGTIAKIFGSSSAPTTSDGGWQTGTQTSGLVGSGGVGNTLSGLGSSASNTIGDLGSSIGSAFGFAKGGATSSNPYFSPVQASMPSLPAAQATMPVISAPTLAPATMPTVAFPWVPQAHTSSSGKGSGGAVRGFADGGDADFGDADADHIYSIRDAFDDGNSVLLGRQPDETGAFPYGAVSPAHPGEPGLETKEKANVLGVYQNAWGNVYPPAVNTGNGTFSVGNPDARRFPEVQPAPERVTPQDIIAMLGKENEALKGKLLEIEGAKVPAAVSAPAPDEDAGRSVAAAGYENPLPAEALRGPAFHSSAKTLSDLPVTAAPATNPWQAGIENTPVSPQWQTSTNPAPVSVEDANKAFLANNQGFGLGASFWTYGPGNKTLADLGTETSVPAAPATETPSNLPENIPLPTRRPANLGKMPQSSTSFDPGKIQAAIDGTSEKAPSKAVNISGPLESGSKNPLKGVGNISPDTNGSHSYGNLGLNSQRGASAWEFQREYGSLLGLTAHPGTPQFDAQWRQLSAQNPQGLVAAENDYWQRHIAEPTQAQLLRIGIPDEWARDPRVLSYVADRKVQQGPESTINHGQRILDAANHADSAEQFLANLSAEDKAHLHGDFRTYLSQHPGDAGGLVNRINNRFGASLGIDASALAAPLTAIGNAAGEGIGAIGHGIQSAGDTVSSNIGNIADRMRSLLGGGEDANPALKQHDAGLFQSAFGVSPFNLSDNTRNRLMQAATLLSSYGANNLQGGLEHIQDLDVKQKNLARQAQHDALNLKVQLEKLAETQRYHEATEDRWMPFNVKGEDGKEQTIRVNQRTGEEVPMQYKSIASGTRGNSGSQLTAPAKTSQWLVDNKIAPDLTTAYGMVHSGVNDAATFNRLVLAEKNGIRKSEDAKIGGKKMSEADMDALAQKMVMDRMKTKGQGLMQQGAEGAQPAVSPAQQPTPTQSASPAPQQQAAPQAPQQGNRAIARARAAIAAGAPREAVIKRLQDNGIDPSGL